jgi:hypothetical protein
MITLYLELGGVRGVVCQRELDYTAVYSGTLAVPPEEIIEPGHSAEQLPIDSSRTLGRAVSFKDKDWIAGAAIIDHLLVS